MIRRCRHETIQTDAFAWLEQNAASKFDLVILDPPYSDDEAAWLYSTPPLKPGKYTAEAVRVCRDGGHIAVYHRQQPRRPTGTKLVRRIVILTRTGHAPRVCFVFQKLPAGYVHPERNGGGQQALSLP